MIKRKCRWAQRGKCLSYWEDTVHGGGWHLSWSLEALSNVEEEDELPTKTIEYAKACRSVGWMWWEKEGREGWENHVMRALVLFWEIWVLFCDTYLADERHNLMCLRLGVGIECCQRDKLGSILKISRWTNALALRLEREEWDILEAEIRASCWTVQRLKEHLITGVEI